MAKKYLDPKADLTFNKVFGEHKNLIISFLNALLPLDEDKEIVSIEYLPAELVPETPLGIVEESAYNEAEMLSYEKFWDAVSCRETILADAERARAAIAEMKTERDEAKEKLRQSARQMKADCLPVETIFKYTGLDTSQIETL